MSKGITKLIDLNVPGVFGIGPKDKWSYEADEMTMDVLKDKYLKDGENPEQMFSRVAASVAEPLRKYDFLDDDDIDEISELFYLAMVTKSFMPNSPTLMNAGKFSNQLAACFVVPVEDSMEGIFRRAIADMAMIQRTGGGTGFDFSKLRPKGSEVSSTVGKSSGPISFMQAFNSCTDTIKQGGARRGANMGILRCDHPDILDFINCKNNLSELNNFNISVAITEDFMQALEEGKDIQLIHEGEVYGDLSAQLIWDQIAEQAWKTGEPGIVFIDEVNDKNMLKQVGLMTATNPCGEQPLLSYEACNLGSINLAQCVDDGVFNQGKLKKLTELGVLFLDCVIDAGSYPLPEIDAQCKKNRKIGLGVMGFAEMLALCEIGYDTPEAISVAKSIMQTINETAYDMSCNLGDLFGSFPNYIKSEEYVEGVNLRNATRTTIAPTGTISLISGTSYGIEPYFALTYHKNIIMEADDAPFITESYEVLCPPLQEYLNKHDFSEEQQKTILSYIKQNGTFHNIALAGLQGISMQACLLLEDIFKTAQDINYRDHIKIQAAFQEHVDNAVSKTINLLHDTTVRDVKNAYELAYRSLCKGITVYRDGCRQDQPMTIDVSAPVDETGTLVSAAQKTNGRPECLSGYTKQIPTGCGMMLVTANLDSDGNLYELLMRAGAQGGCSAFTDAVARLVSISIRHGVPAEVLIDQMRSVRCDNFRFQSGRNPDLKGKSCPDVAGIFLEEILKGEEEDIDVWLDREDFLNTPLISEVDKLKALGVSDKDIDEVAYRAMIQQGICPECGKKLNQAEGCLTCICGFSKC